jgi:hypothetical protein
MTKAVSNISEFLFSTSRWPSCSQREEQGVVNSTSCAWQPVLERKLGGDKPNAFHNVIPN